MTTVYSRGCFRLCRRPCRESGKHGDRQCLLPSVWPMHGDFGIHRLCLASAIAADYSQRLPLTKIHDLTAYVISSWAGTPDGRRWTSRGQRQRAHRVSQRPRIARKSRRMLTAQRHLHLTPRRLFAPHSVCVPCLIPTASAVQTARGAHNMVRHHDGPSGRQRRSHVRL